MYTQCPDCATVFRVTAEALRVAQGDVRCGVCATSFNALENLSERPFAAADEDSPSPDDSMTVEELPGTENIELSAPAELAVVADPPAPESMPDDPAAADDARALEFHGGDAELDRVFVVENPELADSDPTDEHPILVLESREDANEPGLEIEDEDEVEVESESIVVESPAPSSESPSPPPAHPAQAPPPVSAPMSAARSSSRILIPDEMRKRLAEEAAAREEAARAFESAIGPTQADARRWPWKAGVAVLAVLLGLQLVHAGRHSLARSPGLGPAIAGAYGILGLSFLAPTDLAAYELRSWGAASDPNQPGRLMLRASIVNRASYAQPLPQLRLVLQDRFGGTLGLRDIGPPDYLPGAGGQGLLEPGERADAIIRIVDPGDEAVGFELDVCLPASGGVRCASQVTTARR